jgi:predicted SAM-dependent methyltransferase
MTKSKKEEEVVPDSKLEGLPGLTVKGVLQKEVVRLDLGGGTKPTEGYVNIDVQYYPGVDLMLDVTKLDEYFPAKSVDAIMCRDTLQCFPYSQIRGILKRWQKVLKPRSRLVIQCYDINQILEQFSKRVIDSNRFKLLVYGKQSNEHTTYRNCFDEEYLVNLLQLSGFTIQEVTHPEMRIKVVAIREK